MPKQHGSVNSDTKPIERKDEEEEYNPQPDNQSKMQKEEYFIKNACYSVTKSYLCKQNNKRSLLGRKQRSQVARSFPNRYLFSCVNKVTSLFSDRYIFIIILQCDSLGKDIHLQPNIESQIPIRYRKLCFVYGVNDQLQFSMKLYDNS